MSRLSKNVFIIIAVTYFFVPYINVIALNKDDYNSIGLKTTFDAAPYNNTDFLDKDKNKLSENLDETKIKQGPGLESKMEDLIVDFDSKTKFSQEFVADNNKNWVEGEVLIKYKKDEIDLKNSSGTVKSREFSVINNIEKLDSFDNFNIELFKSNTKSTKDLIDTLKDNINVEYIEPNYRRYVSEINTNDTYKNVLWGLDNIGQSVAGEYFVHVGQDDKDMDIPEAWSINEGNNSSVIIAVIDSGVAYNHPDLINNMWDGTSCKNENNIFLGNCKHGYDYDNNDNDPLPSDSSHGTHVAGIIAATKNNGKGVIGVAPNAKIMAIKFGFTTASEIKAIDFAINNGAKIINASFGGNSYSQLEYDAINKFKNAGGLFIAAAGNDNNNNDSNPTYPCSYNLDNIICVAATDQNDNLANFSNYGINSVDVGAPGTNIYSTIANTTLINETFNSLTPPAVPNYFTLAGKEFSVHGSNYFRTDYFNASVGNVLWSDNIWNYSGIYHYLDNNISNITLSNAIDFRNTSSANINFIAACDTEYFQNLGDFMYLDFSNNNGSTWSNVARWNELWLDDDYNEDNNGYRAVASLSFDIPQTYLNESFKFRFRWESDSGNVPDINYEGCFIDNLNVIKYSDGSDEKYEYYNGTSMAAPYVTGLVALISGYKSDLNYKDIRDVVLNTGDSIGTLSGKTVTGKRINAYNALLSIETNKTYNVSGSVKYYDGVKNVIGANVILEDPGGNIISTDITDGYGYYNFSGVYSGCRIRVEKIDNTSRGVNSFDLIRMRRHVVGLEIFDSIYKKIAGDIDVTLSINSFDIIRTRRLLVGLEYPANTWRFYKAINTLDNTNYLNTNNYIEYLNLTSDLENQDFIGIKIGDVDNSWTN